ncbi:MAG: hypothetical protein PHU95_01945 [Candidatus Thermoplasmatota archaeon]|nr:hypothetical protein [Candidatus Thermoplasmatota archaeon]MDD5778193.1 hypothetical protein [Candidatus Thermoplasmatota archaeon]
MTELIYAVQVNNLYHGGLRVLDVKIGRTTNIKRTLTQYRRIGRDIELLDLWEINDDLTASQCEKGVHKVASQYAFDKRSEKFIFLQDDYDTFAENINLLLKHTSRDKLQQKKQPKKKKVKADEYTGKKPKFIKFGGKTTEANTWREVVQTVAKQIYDDADDFSRVFTIKGRKRNYFSEDCRDKKEGGELVNAIAIPNTSYCFEGNISANHSMKLILELLALFGYDADELEIGYSR